jgi:hypothetical protein
MEAILWVLSDNVPHSVDIDKLVWQTAHLPAAVWQRVFDFVEGAQLHLCNIMRCLELEQRRYADNLWIGRSQYLIRLLNREFGNTLAELEDAAYDDIEESEAT